MADLFEMAVAIVTAAVGSGRLELTTEIGTKICETVRALHAARSQLIKEDFLPQERQRIN